MRQIASVEDIREYVRSARASGPVAFVPTMGFLHDGHLSLVRKAKLHAATVLVSVFVNPSQFNDPKDFEQYPIDLDRDFALLSQAGVNAMFVPTVESIYPGGLQQYSSWVNEERLSRLHEGEYRPGHFRGVATVVTRLFNLVRPDIAVFGEKDFQQVRIVEKITAELGLGVQILRAPLLREQDGLALSSRNVRLSPQGRAAALQLSRGLFKAKELFEGGETSADLLVAAICNVLNSSALVKPEYVRVVDETELQVQERASRGDRILLAAYVEGVRLIDNIRL